MRLIGDSTGWQFLGPMYRHGYSSRKLLTRRIIVFQYFIVVCFLLIGAGYWRMQISHYRLYARLAEDNQVRDLPIIATRGRILDREGRVLAESAPSFTIMLHGASNPLTDGEIGRISDELGLDGKRLKQLSRAGVSSTMFRPQVLKRAATLEDIAFIESHRWEYPELDLIHFPRRSYPQGDFTTHLLGHVGEVSERMLSESDSRFRMGGLVGRSGMELIYDEVLAGRDGTRRVIVDSRGREYESETLVETVVGHDIRLTLDLDLQRTAEDQLGEHEGAVVVLDPRTGEVLAMVSRPSFDPGILASRLSPQVWKKLVNDPGKPLLNRATQAYLAPGSVFKMIVAAAALESGIVDPSFRLFCKGRVTYYGHTFRDWVRNGHGWVNLHRAIVRSCDVYFYRLGDLLGIQKIAHFAKGMGLGSPTGIDLPSEAAGLIPSPEWVARRFKRQWLMGETISVAIGQGAVAVTPLQLAYVIGGIASGGVFRRPSVVFRNQLTQLDREIPELIERRFPLLDSTVEALCRGMWGVVNEDGTAARGRIPGLDIAGKTGTAQMVSKKTRAAAGKEKFKANAWFVGLYPPPGPGNCGQCVAYRGRTLLRGRTDGSRNHSRLPRKAGRAGRRRRMRWSQSLTRRLEIWEVLNLDR